jgi:dipeptidyl aminopeptidase/acylaminoacyl peptidase
MTKLRHFSLGLAMLLLAGAISTRAQGPVADNGKITERTPYAFAPFERVDGLSKVVSRQDYEQAVADTRFQMVEVKYLSDGLTVTAYLYQPRETAGKKLPVIVYNRGGYIVGNMGYELAPFFHRLAVEGFVVLAPLLRGSNGAAGKDEVGGGDVDDLMNTLPLLRALEFVDQKNLFMYGESRGGMMTFQAIRDGYPLKAAATFGGFTDFAALVAAKPELYGPLNKQIWPDYEARKQEIADRRSAVHWSERLNVPLLLMHGGADRSVDPAQTLNLAQLLQKAGRSYELVIFNGADHTLSKIQPERDARAVAWFKKHTSAEARTQ